MSRGYGAQYTDTAAFAALLNELRGPLTGVAASLSKSGSNTAGTRGFGEEDLRKLNFRELAERFEHLSQVLPDALRCVQDVKNLQQSVQERLEVLEGRQQSEEAYLASLQELQVKEVEGDKVSVIERQREQCISVVENMRAASRQARQALSDEDPTTWLDNGRHIEQMLTDQNAVKVDYGVSPDMRFGCTLTVDLQRRILEVIDFDEKKGPGSPAKPGAQGITAFKASPFTATTGLNQSTVSAINDMMLPDGTDYATFRRSLLAEGVDASTLYRNSLANLGRAGGGEAARGGGGYGGGGGAAGGNGKPGAMM